MGWTILNEVDFSCQFKRKSCIRPLRPRSRFDDGKHLNKLFNTKHHEDDEKKTQNIVLNYISISSLIKTWCPEKSML